MPCFAGKNYLCSKRAFLAFKAVHRKMKYDVLDVDIAKPALEMFSLSCLSRESNDTPPQERRGYRGAYRLTREENGAKPQHISYVAGRGGEHHQSTF